jgi:mono/diheme cytochrome c family protein
MNRVVTLVGAILLVCLGAVLAPQKNAQAKGKESQAAEPAPGPIPADAVNKVNPVKPTVEGLAAAKKLYGYHCAMCHGKDGDGKGDLAADMKLELNDWRDAKSIAKMTDGELFYIVTNGRGKMIGGEGDRTKDEIRWNLVSVIRSFAKKGT